MHICSGYFTQVSEPWPVGLLLFEIQILHKCVTLIFLHVIILRRHQKQRHTTVTFEAIVYAGNIK